MSPAHELDLGPLTWVKGEIDLALERAATALAEAETASDRLGRIKFAQTHLHQAHGALSIVGLDGLTQFSDMLDRLFGELSSEHIAYTPAVGKLATRALAAIGNYLEELSRGQPDQSLRLFDLYSELAVARKLEAPTPSELFFPDLTLRPLFATQTDPSADDPRALRALRGRFERGLLKWFRNAQDAAGPIEMRDAVAGIERTQALPASRAFWLAAAAFFDALGQQSIPVDASLKRLCGRIDAQMRRLMEGSSVVAERLMRDVLYQVAIAGNRSPAAETIRETYQLGRLIPAAGSRINDTPLAPVLRALREGLAEARDTWTLFSNGGAIGLPRFQDAIAALPAPARALGQAQAASLLEALVDFAQWLRQDPLRLTEALSMDVATTMLLVETLLESHEQPGPGRNQQIATVLERLKAHQRGERLAPLTIAEPDSQAQQLGRQLAHEILSNLAEVEQHLDGFFREPARTELLSAAQAPLKQIEGALSVMNEQKAVVLVRESAVSIAALASGGAAPAADAFESIAHRLSALGIYVEALQNGPADLERILNPAEAETPPAEESIESELAQQKRDTVALAAALKDNPDDIGLRTELQLNLEGLRQDATLTADVELEKQAREALTLLDAGELFSTPASITPEAETPALSPEASRLLAASDEEVDAELLSIFIEEASQVRTTIASNLVLLENAPHDADVLTTIRRSFHTLKGSGRMVGLKDFGEASWGIEQTLNHWLRQERPATPELLQLIGKAHGAFSDWVDQLESGGSIHKDVSALMAEAEQLRSEDEPQEIEPRAVAPATEDTALDLESSVILPLSDFTADGEPAPSEAHTPAATPAGRIADLGIDLNFPDLNFLDEAAPVENVEAPAPHPVEDALDLDEDIASDDILEPVVQAGTVEAVALDDLEEPLDEQALEEDFPEEEVAEATLPAVVPGESDIEDVSPQASQPEAEDFEPEPEVFDDIESATEEIEADDDAVRLGDITLSRPLFDLYLAEARQHVASLRHELGRLAVNPSLVPATTAIRAAHTLSGISGTARFAAPQALSKALELAQQRLADHSQAPSAEQAQILNSAAGTLESMLVHLASRNLPPPAPTLVAQLDDILTSHLAEVITLRPDAADTPPPELVTAQLIPRAESTPRAAATTPDIPAPGPQLRDELDLELLPIFLDEGTELLDGLDTALRNWRANPTESAHAGAVARLLHTLKGSARMVGAMNLGESIHELETRLDKARSIDPGGITVIDDIEAALDRARQSLETLSEPAKAAPVEAARPATGPVFADAAEVEHGAPAAAARTQLRVEAVRIDQFVNEAGEISIARTRIEGELRTVRRSLLDLTENVIRLRNQLREVEIQADSQMQSRLTQVETRHTEFDPLEMDRYTRLQELTRMMAESVGDVTTVQQNLLRNLDGAEAALHAQSRMARDLQQSLMHVRMVPFDSLSERLYRLVRQSAKELGRRANLDIIGGQIEIDRSVLEAMTGPLGHLVRNAVAHGIEPSEVRRAAGKPEIGQITLRVSHEGNEVVIEFRDDGAGLDFKQIRAHALESGLIGADEDVDDKRLTSLIFVPGFTTASLSSLAGRGVGMDVVKSETAAVGGRISVDTEPGRGTSFRIHLPLTLAVTQALMVRAAGRTFAIPSSMVAQVLELKAPALETLREARGTMWMGEHFGYRYLPRLLGDQESQPQVERFNWVLLLRAGSETLALHVDALRGNQEIVVKNAGPQYARMVGYSGATVMGDGEIVLILNPVALAARSPSSADDAPLRPLAAPVQTQPTVMVVDDSLTVRKITGRLLEREGYRVVTAKDGVDALEQLLTVFPDVIIADIEMPRMDGFDLTRNIRADAKLKAVPVIMITSRMADKHKRYAEEIGVNHYLGKPYDEEQLLKLIQGYIAPA